MSRKQKTPTNKRATPRSETKPVATDSSPLPKPAIGTRSSLCGTIRLSGHSPRATPPSAKPNDITLNGYAMRRYTQQGNRQYWRCVFVGSGCPGFAKADIGSATPEETRSHNHEPGMRPEKASGRRSSAKLSSTPRTEAVLVPCANNAQKQEAPVPVAKNYSKCIRMVE